MKKFRPSLTIFLILVLVLCAVACNWADLTDGGTGAIVDETENTTEIKNVILMIGDGMGPEHVKAGEREKGAPLAMQTFPYNTFVNTNSLNTPTDSAAAATALATGNTVKNGVISVDTSNANAPYKTIIDHAKEMGKSTGIVTTDNLYGATPAAFSAHAKSRNDSDDIVKGQAESGIDLLAGTSKPRYLETFRTDFESNGYEIITKLPAPSNNADTSDASSAYQADAFSAIENTPSKVLAQFDFKIGKGSSGSVDLKDAVLWALDFLSQNEDGFFLMVEGAKIDSYSHGNDFESMLVELFAFDAAVKIALDWAKARTDTAIFVTADHETGGLYLTDSSPFHRWATTGHTASLVYLFAYGVSLQENDYIKNVAIFHTMLAVISPEK